MNISEVLGIKAVRYFLMEYPLLSRFSLKFVEEAILLVLRNNISFFDGKYKRQIHGCANAPWVRISLPCMRPLSPSVSNSGSNEKTGREDMV